MGSEIPKAETLSQEQVNKIDTMYRQLQSDIQSISTSRIREQARIREEISKLQEQIVRMKLRDKQKQQQINKLQIKIREREGQQRQDRLSKKEQTYDPSSNKDRTKKQQDHYKNKNAQEEFTEYEKSIIARMRVDEDIPQHQNSFRFNQLSFLSHSNTKIAGACLPDPSKKTCNNNIFEFPSRKQAPFSQIKYQPKQQQPKLSNVFNSSASLSQDKLKQISQASFLSNNIPVLTNSINRASAYYEQFRITGQMIEKKNSGRFQLLSEVLISQKKINKFKITKSKNCDILLGIMDRKYAKDKNATNRKQCICYVGYSGAVFASKKKKHQGVRMQVYEQVTMMVVKDRIFWSANNFLKADYVDSMISDPSIEWVPFIMMLEKGDTLKWQ